MNKAALRNKQTTEYADMISRIIASHAPDTALTNTLQDAALSIVDEVRNSICDGLQDFVKDGSYSDEAVSFQYFLNTTSAKHLEMIFKLCPTCDSSKVLSDLQEIIKVSAAYVVNRLRISVLPEQAVSHGC